VGTTGRVCNTLLDLRLSRGGYKNFIFWGIMPCSPVKVKRYFGRTFRLHLQVWRISYLLRAGVCLVYFSCLETEARCSFEKSSDCWTDYKALYPRTHNAFQVFVDHRMENDDYGDTLTCTWVCSRAVQTGIECWSQAEPISWVGQSLIRPARAFHLLRHGVKPHQ
jgi:hypothetical protein